MSHDHHHHHHHAPATFNLAFALSVILNLAFTLVEAIYAINANSMSLLADAGHNLGDVLGLGLAWLATWLLTRPANPQYSYGYKRTTILAAIVNALILVLTSIFIFYESINKLLHPGPINEIVIIIVALIGIFINGGTALLFMRGRHDDLNIKGAFLHLAYDALISFGVVIAGIIVLYTHWLWLDPIVGILIVLTILAGTWSLLRDSINLILDAVPTKVDGEAVKNYLISIDNVSTVHHLHIWGLSTKEVALTAHLVLAEGGDSTVDYNKINHDLKHNHNIDHVTLQIEKSESACSASHCSETKE